MSDRPASPESYAGVHIYHDSHLPEVEYEVVPQTTGNVELAVYVKDKQDSGWMFTLHKKDRIHLARILLEGL